MRSAQQQGLHVRFIFVFHWGQRSVRFGCLCLCYCWCWCWCVVFFFRNSFDYKLHDTFLLIKIFKIKWNKVYSIVLIYVCSWDCWSFYVLHEIHFGRSSNVYHLILHANFFFSFRPKKTKPELEGENEREKRVEQFVWFWLIRTYWTEWSSHIWCNVFHVGTEKKRKRTKNSNNNGYKFTDSIHSPFIRESTFSSINTNTSGRQQKKLIRKKTWSEWRNWIMEERKTERKQPNEEEDVGSIETTTPCIHL